MKWLGVTVVAIAVTVTPVAMALTRESRKTQIGTTADGAATASCSGRGEAVSGGFKAPGFNNTPSHALNLPFASRRKGDGGWKAQAHNFSAMSDGPFVAFAYCAKHAPRLHVASKSTTVLALSNGSVTAKCPGGTEAVSGGFAAPKGGTKGATLFPYESKRVGDRKWRVSAVSNDAAASHKLTASAECDKRKPGLATRSKQDTVDGGKIVSRDVVCRHDKQPVSGGFSSTLDTSTGEVVAFPFTSRRSSSTSWETSFVGNGSTGTSTVTTFAYCRT
jgi:hypothetical protein